MFLLRWLDEFYQIRARYRQEVVCESCEALRSQLAIANDTNRRLLDNLIVKPEEKKIDTDELKPISPRRLPWRAEAQRLSAESARKAKQIKDDFDRENLKIVTKVNTVDKTVEVTPIADVDMDALEAELLNARTEREAQTGTDSK